MIMNWLVLVVIAILLVYGILGYKMGLIKTVFSICSMIVALILTMFITPQVSNALQKNDKVVTYFSEKVEEVLKLDQLDEKMAGVAKEEVIKDLPLPDFIKDALVENDETSVYKDLDVSSFSQYLSHSIALTIIKALSFIATFLILLIVLRILCSVLDIISKLPVLKQINQLTGLAAGLARGLIVIWVLCVVITVFSGTEWGKDCFEMINSNTFLSLLYNNNFILKILA